jgi:YD repeat-containing protein
MIVLLSTILLVLATAASAQTTFRDASGRITGTVSTDSNGTKTFRDGSGRTTGTATRDSHSAETLNLAAAEVALLATSRPSGPHHLTRRSRSSRAARCTSSADGSNEQMFGAK